jgi:hypothetical protein
MRKQMYVYPTADGGIWGMLCSFNGSNGGRGPCGVVIPQWRRGDCEGTRALKGSNQSVERSDSPEGDSLWPSRTRIRPLLG